MDSDYNFGYNRFTVEGFKSDLQLGPVDCSYSAGLRYLYNDVPHSTHYDSRNSGLGPVFGFDASYALPYNFSLYANTELGYYWPVIDSDDYSVEPHDFTWNINVGVRHDISFCPALEGVYVKAGYEWDNFNRISYSNTTQVAGWVFGVGYDF